MERFFFSLLGARRVLRNTFRVLLARAYMALQSLFSSWPLPKAVPKAALPQAAASPGRVLALALC